ncbi:MAG TPA: response regulator transcription factor [Halanaerobiales bacterium]|nr:response regulator transcription factor [Halanaerobiales bacterium]
MSYNVYLVEDDKSLNSILTSYLKNEGWNVKSFHNGLAAVEVIDEKPDIWVLDIMLPDIDGFELIDKIKANDPEIPVIFISARDEDLDRITGLEKGSDDYIAKPFSPRELVIRIKKIFQRIYGDKQGKEIIEYGDYIIDLQSRVVKIDGEQKEVVDLTSREFDLLVFFLNNISHALTREQILNNVWGRDYFGSDRVVDDLIRRLRKKLPDLKIETIYGHGYRLVRKDEV